MPGACPHAQRGWMMGLVGMLPFSSSTARSPFLSSYLVLYLTRVIRESLLWSPRQIAVNCARDSGRVNEKEKVIRVLQC